MIFNHIKKLKLEGKRIGITFSTFDMLHAGHIAMLSEAKNHPVQSIVERQIQLAACRYVDEVVVYQTEQDLLDLLLILPLDVRILGIEYAEKEFTGMWEGQQRDIEIVFNKRDHSFSSSSLRKRVVAAETFKALKQE